MLSVTVSAIHFRLPYWPSRSCCIFDPLKNPTSESWFSCVPVGRNVLSDTVPHLKREAGIEGCFTTNHTLRATATTRLYDAQLDEASIMQHTGHRSVMGVCAYKRETETLCELTSTV